MLLPVQSINLAVIHDHMLRFIIILLLNLNSISGNGQEQDLFPNGDFAVKQINENYLINVFLDSSKYCIEDDNSLNVFGKIHIISEFVPFTEKVTNNFIYSHSVIFVQKLLLFHCIDLPPPRS